MLQCASADVVDKNCQKERENTYCETIAKDPFPFFQSYPSKTSVIAYFLPNIEAIFAFKKYQKIRRYI